MGGEMKATMNEDGVIRVEPENPVEAYALKQWSAQSFVFDDDEQGRCRVSGSKLIVSCEWPPKQEAK